MNNNNNNNNDTYDIQNSSGSLSTACASFNICEFKQTESEINFLRQMCKLWEKDGFWSFSSLTTSFEKKQTHLYYIPDSKNNSWSSCIIVFDGMDHLDILYVFTKQEFRHQGHALALFKHILSLIDSRSKDFYIHLEVKSTNTIAKNLYEKIGFRFQSVKKKYYSTGEDAIIYRYSFDN